MRAPTARIVVWAGLWAATLGACTPELGGPASPAAGWPDLADPPVGRLDGRADAAIIVAIDDPALDGRPGAWEVGSGWWRYLVHTRGLRPRRVQLLRNDEASAARIRLAVERMKHESDEGSMLWLIFIGGGSSPSDAVDGTAGRLHAGDGELLAFEPLRRELGAGFHESATIVLDACAATNDPGWRSGIPGRFPEPPPLPKPPLPYEFSVEAKARRMVEGGGPAAAAALARAKVEWDAVLGGATPRNTFVLTAGTDDACASSLAGRPWPALAYATLGGLQGWSDLDEDGWVTGRELTLYAQALVTELDRRPCERDPQGRIEAGGVDLILADVAGASPHPARVAWRRRDDQRFEPGLAGQSTASYDELVALAKITLEDMVAVPSGRFVRGCDRAVEPDCERDERPQRTLTLGAFTIDRTEVTWADYRECVARRACEPTRPSACWVWDGGGFSYGAELPAAMLGDDHPVVCVTWEEAVGYCAAQGKRLPTEAEWERAARGVDGHVYPWGDEPPTCETAIMDGCSNFTSPVASLVAGASPVGALDMAGNASEWVFDWWHQASYRRSIWPDPTGPESGRVRVVRGGSFYEGENELRSGYRYGLDPEARLSTIGFRCAR